MLARMSLFGVILLSCVTTYAQDGGTPVAALAQAYLGVPYRWGGNSPDGFDCSGLVQHIHRLLGRDVPRTAHTQYLAAQPVALEQLRAGDLLFFRMRDRLSHVAIYVGAGRFIHAPSRGKKVSYAELENPFWRARLQGAGRLP